jgi:putative redox protein
MVTVNWKGGMAFESAPPSGSGFVMDAHPDYGGQGLGPSPVEAFLSAVAACSAMDVIAVMQKKRQEVTSYRIEIDGERTTPGEFPRPFTSIVVRHILTGKDLDEAAVQKAVELSDQKYCSVIATLRQCPAIGSEWRIE